MTESASQPPGTSLSCTVPQKADHMLCNPCHLGGQREEWENGSSQQETEGWTRHLLPPLLARLQFWQWLYSSILSHGFWETASLTSTDLTRLLTFSLHPILLAPFFPRRGNQELLDAANLLVTVHTSSGNL